MIDEGRLDEDDDHVTPEVFTLELADRVTTAILS